MPSTGISSTTTTNCWPGPPAIHPVTRPLTVHCHQADLAELSSLEIPTPDLVTASALFDLVSAEWIGQLVDQCQRWQAAALLVLTVNGQRGFSSTRRASPARSKILAAPRPNYETFGCRNFSNQHQRQAKGLGTALGPDAIAELERCFQAAGFPVLVAPSDWQLKVDDDMTRQLGPALLDGWRKAALEVAPG